MKSTSFSSPCGSSASSTWERTPSASPWVAPSTGRGGGAKPGPLSAPAEGPRSAQADGYFVRVAALAYVGGEIGARLLGLAEVDQGAAQHEIGLHGFVAVHGGIARVGDGFPVVLLAQVEIHGHAVA